VSSRPNLKLSQKFRWTARSTDITPTFA
ncbi:MAG: hypothetical protein RL591_2430, partial [Planctomycetota bacterium]